MSGVSRRRAPDWFPDWCDETALVVGSGPSAPTVPLDMVRGRVRCIATNNSWKLVPWADAIYATDGSWWMAHNGVPEFSGLKISRSRVDYSDIKRIELRREGNGWHNHMIFKPLGTIGWGGNSGFQAINLAVQFGAKTIVLIGLDMTVKHGVHWHGKHEGGLHNPNSSCVEAWRFKLDRVAPQLAKRGIEVLNASPISALTAYRKVDFREFFGIEAECA